MALGRAGKKKLGKRLAIHAHRLIREMILERGGSAGNVREAGHWADKTLADAAEAAVKRDRTAVKAIKIVKDARRCAGKREGVCHAIQEVPEKPGRLLFAFVRQT
jgi:hypothetical protein